jgi:hypothetical protein
MNLRNTIARFVQSHRALTLVLLAFLALATTYSIVTPIFEAGDEIWHYPFVQHLASGNGLPIQDPNVKTLWEQEGGQPPLYYTLGALATFWIDTRDLPERLWRNPHARIGIPLDYGNKNLIVHTSAENFPWQGTPLAVHLIRFLSILLSTFTVALTYLLALEIGNDIVIARSVFRDEAISNVRIGDCFAKTARNDNDIVIARSVFRDEAISNVRIGDCFAKTARNDNERKTLAAFAAALVAFNPMFLFISASVNNDNLATMLATLALLLLAQLITRGTTQQRFIALGIVLGLGALTKVSLLGLLIVAAVVFAYLLWQEIRHGDTETRRQGEAHVPLSPCRLVSLLKPMILCAGIVIAIAFWWYARNWILYGDFSAFNVWVQIAGGRPTPVTFASLLNEFQGFRISFWGNFGGVNIIAPEWVYIALDVFTVLAVIGLFIGLVRRTLPRLLWLPALWLALISILLIRWTFLTMASQGRLIFPAIAAVAVLFTYGLVQFQWLVVSGQWSEIKNYALRITHYVSRFTPHVSRFTSYVLLLPFAFCLFTFSALAPFTIIAPTYALPARFADDARVPHPLHLTFNDQAELVGYALPHTRIAPGDTLPLTIFWRAREPLNEDFSVYVRLFDAEDKIITRWDAFPGRGLYPTRVWQPGEIVTDEYRLPIPLDARAGVGRIEVGLFRRVPLETLTARDPRGNIITPTIARFKIAGQAKIQPIENPVVFKFGDRIELVGYSLVQNIAPGSTLPVKLYWRALKPIAEDYTVFVHFVDTNGNIIAQKDNQPQHNTYPTSFWDVGETIADEYALEIPPDVAPGNYRLMIGMYRTSDGARLLTREGDHIELSLRVEN